jgi:hypothetical protein
MTWTADEWEAFCGLLEEGWPGEFDDDAAASWRTLLDSTPPAVAITALRRLLLEGHRFRPSVSELLAACRTDPSRPSFEEALALIKRALKVRSPDGAFASERQMLGAHHMAMQERLQTLNPFVAAFTARFGFDRLSQLQLDHPEWAEKTRRDLQAAWDRHTAASEGREVALLASGGRGGLAQLDPLATLPRLSSASAGSA